jgi:hypothetical protein
MTRQEHDTALLMLKYSVGSRYCNARSLHHCTSMISDLKKHDETKSWLDSPAGLFIAADGMRAAGTGSVAEVRKWIEGFQ